MTTSPPLLRTRLSGCTTAHDSTLCRSAAHLLHTPHPRRTRCLAPPHGPPSAARWGPSHCVERVPSPAETAVDRSVPATDSPSNTLHHPPHPAPGRRLCLAKSLERFPKLQKWQKPGVIATLLSIRLKCSHAFLQRIPLLFLDPSPASQETSTQLNRDSIENYQREN
jgi:hypothetical protein